jgi:hypothetical protein
MPRIENGSTPTLLSVRASASLVVPDRSGPNLRLVGLIVAAGVTVTTFDFVIALVVPEIVTALLLSAGIVVTSKG